MRKKRIVKKKKIKTMRLRISNITIIYYRQKQIEKCYQI